MVEYRVGAVFVNQLVDNTADAWSPDRDKFWWRRGYAQAMRISLSEAEAQLPELVRRAEAGQEVVLTRHGKAVARLVPVGNAVDGESRKALLETLRASGRAKATVGPSAARSQDFLYRDDDLPG